MKIRNIEIAGLVKAERENSKDIKVILHFRNKNYANEFLKSIIITDSWK